MTFNEKHLVEDYIIKCLEGIEWKFIPADTLERESYEEPLLMTSLIRNLQKINKESNIGDEEIKKVLNELKLTGTGIEGAKRILNFYKFGIPVKFEKEKVVKYIRLFDFQNIENNEFVVSRQVYHYAKDTIKTDILLYINGIPLVNIECKNPVSISESWHTAYRQIKDYEGLVPELYKYVQIGIAAESIARYFPIVSWQKEVEKHRNPIYESLVEKVERLLELWKEKTRDYERIYKDGVRAINEINSLSGRQKALGFSDLEYSLLLALEERFGKEEKLLNEIRDISDGLKSYMFPGWLNQPTMEKSVKREVRKFVRGLKGRFNITLDEMDDLYKKLIERVKNYGTS